MTDMADSEMADKDMAGKMAGDRAALLDAALMHVPFDGWTEAAFQAAVADSGLDPALARALCPRGGVDLALAYHARGDAEMVRRLQETDLSGMKFRDRIALAVRCRLEAVEDRELVQRGTTLFALPRYAGDGARAIWGTADLIWRTLGDSSDDINWYTKRATLSGVYAATVLFWLGDDSPDHDATWAFLDRRIDDVMQIEKVKARVRENPVLGRLLAGPMRLMESIHAPRDVTEGLPGHWHAPR